MVRAEPFAFTREQLNGVCVDPASVPFVVIVVGGSTGTSPPPFFAISSACACAP